MDVKNFVETNRLLLLLLGERAHPKELKISETTVPKVCIDDEREIRGSPSQLSHVGLSYPALPTTCKSW